MNQRDMEEDIRKKGMLYVQQQRFGKKWRKVWSILYRESTCSISRLEFFECKDGTTSTLEKSKSKQENKKIIRMSDCIRVSEAVDVDGCPKDCKAFLVETTEKTFVFAVETVEAEDWMQKLCEIAFPMNWSERGVARKNSSPPDPDDASMTNNSLYCGKEAASRDFKVVIRRSDAAERCSLKGLYLLRTDYDSLLLKEPKTGEVHFTWPYRFLRRFGRDKATFSFEAGRRCDSGEGNFEFETKQGNAIFQSVEASINLQRAGFLQQSLSGARDREALPMPQPPKITPPTEEGSSAVYSMLSETAMKDKARQSPPHRAKLEMPTDKHLTGVKSLNLDTRPLPRKNQVKNFRSCPLANTDEEAYSRVTAPLSDKEIPDQVAQEEQHQTLRPCTSSPDPEYSLPFDNIAKNIMKDILMSSSHLGPPMVVEPCKETRDSNEKTTEPLYDIIDESAVRSFPQKPKRRSNKYLAMEHIYDEPEGCATTPHAPTALYDDPEEVRNNAWQTLGAVHDPSGHEFPYNAHVDDYAVPKLPRRVKIPELERERGEKSKKSAMQTKDDEESSPYDNVVLKMKTGSLNE